MSPRIFVESEFAPLHTVVLAQSQMRLPDPDILPPDVLEAEMAILPAEERSIAVSLLGRDHAEAMPERQRAWEAERTAFGAVMERHGVEVLRPALLTDAQRVAGGPMGYSNSFVRDPWFTVGGTVIEGSLRFPHRRGEVLPSRPIFEHEVLPADCAYIATPQPEILDLDDEIERGGPYLEGGDVLVLGHHVFVGISGRASSVSGAAFLRKVLGPQGYTVEEVRLKPTVLHLDCAVGLVRDGLCVVAPDVFLDGVPDRIADWDRVVVSEADAMALGTNGLPLSPDVYVADPEFSSIGDALERHGITVEYVDFTISRAFGGAFRCSSQALWRE